MRPARSSIPIMTQGHHRESIGYVPKPGWKSRRGLAAEGGASRANFHVVRRRDGKDLRIIPPRSKRHGGGALAWLPRRKKLFFYTPTRAAMPQPRTAISTAGLSPCARLPAEQDRRNRKDFPQIGEIASKPPAGVAQIGGASCKWRMGASFNANARALTPVASAHPLWIESCKAALAPETADNRNQHLFLVALKTLRTARG